jgi:hypothetical protein
MWFEARLGKKKKQDLISNTQHKKGLVEWPCLASISPEFKPQYHQNKTQHQVEVFPKYPAKTLIKTINRNKTKANSRLSSSSPSSSELNVS